MYISRGDAYLWGVYVWGTYKGYGSRSLSPLPRPLPQPSLQHLGCCLLSLKPPVPCTAPSSASSQPASRSPRAIEASQGIGSGGPPPIPPAAAQRCRLGSAAGCCHRGQQLRGQPVVPSFGDHFWDVLTKGLWGEGSLGVSGCIRGGC